MDENYLDLTMMITRTSKCFEGKMGCLLVPSNDLSPEAATDSYISPIIAASINTPFYKPHHSDVHAEINALASCAKRGKSTEGATAYITMPPCKDCFQALVQAGVRRFVSRQRACEAVKEAADRLDLDIVDIADNDVSRERRKKILDASGRAEWNDPVELAKAREFRKKEKAEMRRQKLEKRQRKMEENMANREAKRAKTSLS